MLKFGMTSIFPPVASALEKLRLAEELDFDNFWVADSHVIWNEVYSLLGWLVGNSRSDHIKLGTLVTNPVSRDPIVIASAFATLNQQAGSGRLVCGIGRGDSAVRVLNRRPASVADTERAVEIIRTLASGRPIELDGVRVQIEWASGQIPMYVAAYGPRMLEVAGRVGDGVIIECADPHYVAWALEHVRRGARAAGREPSELAVVSSTATYISEDRETARDQVRSHGAVVGNHVAEVLRNSGLRSLPQELAAFMEGRTEYDYRKHAHLNAPHADYVSDAVIDRVCIVGTVADCAEKLQTLATLGVTHVNFYAQTDDFETMMRKYVREVIPKLRSTEA
jgi:probable F420-dependent oxidoreductase